MEYRRMGARLLRCSNLLHHLPYRTALFEQRVRSKVRSRESDMAQLLARRPRALSSLCTVRLISSCT